MQLQRRTAHRVFTREPRRYRETAQSAQRKEAEPPLFNLQKQRQTAPNMHPVSPRTRLKSAGGAQYA